MQPGVPSWHHPPPMEWPANTTVEDAEVEARLVVEGARSSGSAKMQTATNKSFLVTEFSSEEFAKIPSIQNCPRLYQHFASKLILNRVNKESITHLGNTLIAAAEQSYPVHDNETLWESALLLTTLPDDTYRSIGQYYRALYAIRQRDYRRAKSILGEVVQCGTPAYRARSFVSLGKVYASEGNWDTALESTLEASRLARLDDCGSPMPLVLAKLNMAIVNSVRGNHQQALASLESMLPMVRMMGLRHPQEYYSYFNSLAVEMGAAGRLEEAASIIGMVLRSPIAHTDPEFRATQQEILEKAGRASRSVVAIRQISHIPSNVLRLPVQRQKVHIEPPTAFQPVTRRQGRARILKFRRRNHPMLQRDLPIDQLSKKQKVIKIVDLVTNDLTERQLNDILAAILAIAPENR